MFLPPREPKFHEFQIAYDFLILALEKPLTEDEIRETRAFYSSPMVSDEAIRAGFRLSLLRDLADVCRELNRPEEAQKWMLEEKKLAEKAADSTSATWVRFRRSAASGSWKGKFARRKKTRNVSVV